MIRVKFNNEQLSVKEGTRVLELVERGERKNLVVCQVGAQIKELNYRNCAIFSPKKTTE